MAVEQYDSVVRMCAARCVLSMCIRTNQIESKNVFSKL